MQHVSVVKEITAVYAAASLAGERLISVLEKLDALLEAEAAR